MANTRVWDIKRCGKSVSAQGYFQCETAGPDELRVVNLRATCWQGTVCVLAAVTDTGWEVAIDSRNVLYVADDSGFAQVDPTLQTH